MIEEVMSNEGEKSIGELEEAHVQRGGEVVEQGASDGSEDCPYCHQTRASLIAACSSRVDERLAREMAIVKNEFVEMFKECKREHLAAQSLLQAEVSAAHAARDELRGKLKGLRSKLCPQCKRINA